MKIILIRHAQTIKNKQKIAQGHGDSELTEEGIIQTQKTREYLRSIKINGIYCSDLGRAVKTANIIAEPHNLKPIPDKRLSELNWGDWSILNADDLLKRWSQFYEEQKQKGVNIELIRPPNGENSYDHMGRIKSFLYDLETKHKGDTIMIIGHGGTNKVIIGIFKKVHPEEFYMVKQDNACINILEIQNGILISSDINKVEHLI